MGVAAYTGLAWMAFIICLNPVMMWSSENNIARCFLLEIPLRGFLFHKKFTDKYRIPKIIKHT